MQKYIYKIRQLSILGALLTGMTFLSACNEAGADTDTSSASEVYEETQTAESIDISVPLEDITDSPDEGDEAASYRYTLDKPLLIMMVDPEQQQLILRDISSTRQFLFTYNLNTQFADRNGQFISVAGFTPGRIAKVESVSDTGLLSNIRLSDDVWEYSGISKYTLDKDRGVLTIGSNNNYRIDEDVPVFSGNVIGTIDDIGKNDILRITGQDRRVLAVTITTGHGVLSLINTTLFKDSLIGIGKTFTLIKGDMQIEVPEGTYKITVANNGYGGSTNVQVVRNEIVTLDLDTLKGDGPAKCKLKLKTDVPDAIIRIDGNTVTENEEMEISYGRHLLSVDAPGYESWSKYLYVNSPTATILLEMTEDGTVTAGPGDDEDEDSEEDEEDENSNESQNSSEASEEERQQAELDYLTTINNMITSLFSN